MLNNIVDNLDNVGSTTLFNAVFVRPEQVVRQARTGCVVRPEQVVRFLLCTQQKMNNLFWFDENRLEQCFAANILQCCQQCRSVLLHLIAG